MNIEYEPDPSAWIARHGAPAEAVGGWRDGMPSFEHEDNGFVVYDLLLVASHGGKTVATPHWYGTACIISPDDMVPLHHEPGALWEFRPLLYHVGLTARWGGMSSQTELRWRFGLSETQKVMHEIDVAVETEGEHVLDEPERWLRAIGVMIAERKADELLAEHITPQQKLELVAGSTFRLRGASGAMYEVQLGDGFRRVNPLTGQTLASYCWHTDQWIPAGDVALATMLQLQDPELEVEALAEANGHDYSEYPQDPADAWDRAAAERERELIPA